MMRKDISSGQINRKSHYFNKTELNKLENNTTENLNIILNIEYLSV